MSGSERASGRWWKNDVCFRRRRSGSGRFWGTTGGALTMSWTERGGPPASARPAGFGAVARLKRTWGAVSPSCGSVPGFGFRSTRAADRRHHSLPVIGLLRTLYRPIMPSAEVSINSALLQSLARTSYRPIMPSFVQLGPKLGPDFAAWNSLATHRPDETGGAHARPEAGEGTCPPRPCGGP
jgi:hypothetical protein